MTETKQQTAPTTASAKYAWPHPKSEKAKAIRARADVDFFYFVDRLLLGPSMGKGNKICRRADGVHKAMTDFVETTEKDFGTDPADVTLALAPRGYYKTTIMVVGYCLWRMARNPKIRILLVSESGIVAQERLVAIKTHCQQNTDMLTIYPWLSEGKVWKESKIKIKGFNRPGAMECSIRAVGITSKITGQHYDLIMCDDVVGPSNTNTPAQCLKTRDYYQRLQPILEQGGMTSQLRVVGTVWHFADLHCHLLKQSEDADSPVKALRLSCYDKFREPTWGEVYGHVELEKIRKKIGDPQKWANQYENVVIDEADRLVSPDRWAQFIVDTPAESHLWPAFAAIDPSMGASTDLSAMVTWLLSPDRIPYIVDIYAARVRPEELLRECLARHMRYHYRSIFFEMHDQENLWRPLVSLSGDEFRGMPLVSVKRHAPGKTKEVRIRSFGEYVNKGWCRISRSCTNLGELTHQVLFFPRIENDDIIDAASEIVPRTPPPLSRVSEATDNTQSMPVEELRLLMGQRKSLFHAEWFK